MFNKKPRRNFRQRKGKSSDEDEQKSGEGDGSQIQATASSIKPSKLPQNRGISCSSKREAMPPNSDSSGAEDAVEYGTSGPFVGTNLPHSKEDKDGRKKKGNVLSFSNEKEGSEFKLKKSSDKAVVFQARRKEASPVKTSRPTARKDVTVVASPRERSDSDVSGEELSPESDGEGGAKSTTSSSASSMSSRSSRSSKSSTQKQKPVVIPDARRIQAARRQRQAARAQKDYISLGRDGESSPRTPDQDLEEHTEEDDDDEPDDHERRIEFAPQSKTIRERIAEKMGGSDSGASESDEQEREDDNLWQEQQIGKGVKRHPGEQSPSGSEGSGSVRSGSSRRKQRVNIPECMPPVSLSIVKKRITGKLCDLREVHRAHEADLRRMEVDMDSSRTSLENLESGSSDRQLRFYRATNAYIQNLVECLREKVVEINSVEVDMHTLLSDQAEVLLSRRREAIRQESSRLQQLSYATDPQGEGDSGESVNEKPSKSESGEPGEEDYGSLPADSEPSPEEEAELQRERAEILSRSQDVFCDVQEDFWEVKKVLSRFSEWREAFSESYHSAYISLCLPKLLNPLIRHQLLGWSPLQAAGEDFEALPWFSAVETFCHGLGYQEAEHTDRKTLPAIIEKTLLPKIQGFVELVWDPLSSRQSVCLSELCCRLQDDYSLFEGEQSKPVKAFVEAVSGRLRSSVDADVFIPLYPKKFLDDRSSPQRRFRDQQFWTAVKLLGNVGQWDGLISEHVLKELMLDKLLNRYLMMTLLNETHSHDSVHKCKKVAVCFPKSWFKDVSSCPSQLKSFSDHLLQTAHSVCKQQPDHPNTRAVVSDLLTVLGSIQAWDKVETISDKYHYKDLVDTLNLS
ncbi:intron Large complex component GCFC2 [Coregonus clupeaformis]|uniref:intron Large complex component GCFC2 n=1 Tax=Coregonus clupeaformis TaxID=59861 RepID=UPI001E1C83E6|nr:intron Large complex component GCFC2 [Coregonus clupeaformis]